MAIFDLDIKYTYKLLKPYHTAIMTCMFCKESLMKLDTDIYIVYYANAPTWSRYAFCSEQCFNLAILSVNRANLKLERIYE
jgi:hypothetical protein